MYIDDGDGNEGGNRSSAVCADDFDDLLQQVRQKQYKKRRVIDFHIPQFVIHLARSEALRDVVYRESRRSIRRSAVQHFESDQEERGHGVLLEDKHGIEGRN